MYVYIFSVFFLGNYLIIYSPGQDYSHLAMLSHFKLFNFEIDRKYLISHRKEIKKEKLEKYKLSDIVFRKAHHILFSVSVIMTSLIFYPYFLR